MPGTVEQSIDLAHVGATGGCHDREQVQLLRRSMAVPIERLDAAKVVGEGGGVARERGLDKDLIFAQLEKALQQAAVKRFDAEGEFTLTIDRETGEILQGRVPAGAVVVPGSLPAKDGSHSLYCAVIVKKVDAQTRAKTSINELLRPAD